MTVPAHVKFQHRAAFGAAQHSFPTVEEQVALDAALEAVWPNTAAAEAAFDATIQSLGALRDQVETQHAATLAAIDEHAGYLAALKAQIKGGQA